jgi:predicted dehydrogenase
MIGCGFIAGVHLDAYEALREAGREFEVVAAADPLPGRAASFAAVRGIPRALDDYRALLELDEVTAVNVCTSNTSHRDVAVAAAAAGKHVFLEKPIAMTLEEADEVIEACERAGVTLMVGHSQRFAAIHWQLKELIDSGELGRPLHVSTTTFAGYFWPGAWHAWQIDPAQSGGNLVQNGIHDLDLFCWLFGEAPTSVFARGLRLASPALETFDHYHVVAGFPSGATALSTYGYSVPAKDASLRAVYLVGTDGEARYETTADGAWWRSAGADHDVLPDASLFRNELGHWLDCLESGSEPLVRPRQARLALELALAAERSARTGERAELPERPYG